MYHLNFYNKNMYRKYPLKATSGKTTQGKILPTAFFVGCKLSTTLATCHIYLSKLVVKGNYVNGTLSSNNITLGYFSGNITTNNTVLNVVSIEPNFSGMVVIGDKNCLATFQGNHTFTFENGEIEESLIFCYPRPGVTSFVVHGEKLTGNIKLSLNNLTLVEPFYLYITNPNTVISYGDKSALAGNCKTKVVTGINTVSANAAGNIDIFAIAPLTLTEGTGTVQIDSPTLKPVDLCPSTKYPIPTLWEINTYKGYKLDGDPAKDITVTDIPEWQDSNITKKVTQAGKAKIV